MEKEAKVQCLTLLTFGDLGLPKQLFATQTQKELSDHFLPTVSIYVD
jgi:hypothetical protein